MNQLIKFIFLFFLFFSTNVLSIEKGKWTFSKEENWCYIGSIPDNEEGNYTKRGDTYVIVYRINKSQETIVQINAGYNYNEEKEVELTIDQTTFKLFSQGDSAWSANQDKEIIRAMIRGKNMIVKGYSTRNTLTTDTYTLDGFTKAHNKLKSTANVAF